MTDVKALRPAGFNERRCISRDVLGLYGYIVTFATYSILSRPSIARIYQALKVCIAQHPMLGIIVVDAETEKPQLALPAELNLEKHVKFIQADESGMDTPAQFKRYLEQIHNEPFTKYGQIPQWKVWIVDPSKSASNSASTFRVAFACSHVLADGMSGYAFHRTFSNALSRTETSQIDSNPTFAPNPDNKIIPALDRAVNLPISWSFLLPPLVGEFLPSFIVNALGFKDDDSNSKWCGASERPERPMSTKPVRTSVRVLFVSHSTAQRVLEACRNHQARLTGLLNYLMARALSYTLPRHNKDYTSFVAETPIDLRKCIPEATNVMANYASAVEEELHVGPIAQPDEKLTANDWEAIRRSTKLLAQRSSTLSDQPIALLKYLSDFRKWTLKRSSEPAKASFGMSNLGVFDGGANDQVGWNVESMVFSQSADCTGSPLNVNVASVKDGSLAITVTWWPGMLGVQDEETFVEEVCTVIDAQLEATS